MPSNPYVNCAKFETADRRDREQRDEAIARANERYLKKRTERLEKLTSDEVAIIDARERQVAAEAAKQNGTIADTVPDLEPEVPPRLRQPVPELAPGSTVTVEDKPRARR